MEIKWCWRCQNEVAMLDEEEYKTAHKLIIEGFKNRIDNREERFKNLIAFYKKITGVDENNPNVIMHHRISLYGKQCEQCGKPYRTTEAKFCASCGHKK